MSTDITPERRRLYFGGFIFITGFCAPLFIPLVTSSNLSDGWKILLSGFLALGIPEIFMLIAAAILGKQGFTYLKSRLWRFIAPPETVTLLRYRIGLLLLLVPVLYIWLHPYLQQVQPWLGEKILISGLLSVSLITLSLFILGGEFWDKLHGLFLYNARVLPSAEKKKLSEDKIAADEIKLPLPRLLIGGTLFGLSLFSPVFIPLLEQLSMSDELRIVIGGLMIFGIPQLVMILAVSILGKAGFVYLKQRLSGLLRATLSDKVGQKRYRLGIVLFTIPLLIGIGWPYLTIVFESLSNYGITIAITGDLLLVVSIFVLGGEFWEKLLSIFRHQSRVVV